MKRSFRGFVDFDNFDQNEFDYPGCESPYQINNNFFWFSGYISNTQEILRAQEGSSEANETGKFAYCFAAAFQSWGPSLSSHVFGEYSAAIYNPAARTVTLITDLLGICPVFYITKRHSIVFASHLHLIVNRDAAPQLDEEYIADYLCYGDHYYDRTPYMNIKRLTRFTSLAFSARQTVVNKCFTSSDIQPIRYIKQQDYIAHFRQLVFHAVNSAIPARGNTWCELSGGLDSSTVFAAAALSGKAESLSSVSFIYSKSRTADESSYIQAVVDKWSRRSCIIDGDAFPPFSLLPDQFFAQPYHGMTHLALYNEYNNILLNNGVDVVLTGMGGDAVFLGDGPAPFYLAQLLLEGRILRVIRELGRWTNDAVERRPFRYWAQRCAIAPCVNWFNNLLIQDHPPRIPWLDQSYEKGKSRNGKPRKSWVHPKLPIGESWILERVIRTANVIAASDHKLSMAAEFRHPLMHFPLVSFMLSIPSDIQLSSVSDRALQRMAFRDILPDVILNRQTKAGPDQVLFSALENNTCWLKAIQNGVQLTERGYVNRNEWQRAVKGLRLGQCESIKHFKAAATLEVWLQQFAKQVDAA